MSLSIYSINKDAVIASQLVELGKSIPTTTVDPSTVMPITVWFRADSLSSSYSQSQTVTAWNNSYGINLTASIVSGNPEFNTMAIANGKASVLFSGNEKFLLSQAIDLGVSWSVQILFKGNGSDSVLLGNSAANVQIRRFPIGDNTIGAYNGGADLESDTFSSSLSQSAVLTYLFDGTTASFYEGKYARNTGSNLLGQHMTLNVIGRANFGDFVVGDIVEICIWTGSVLSQAQITSLYENYWRQKFYPENLYDLDPFVQSFSIPTTKMKISTGSMGSTITVFNEFVENSSYTKQMNLSYLANLTARSFQEG